MNLKNVDWTIVVQCDFYAIKNFVETSRSAVTLARPVRNFYGKIEKDEVWKTTYDTIVKSYQSLSPNFSIEPDRYEGYGLFYRGMDPIAPKTVLHANPAGFVKPIPDGVTEWSVMTSERTGEQLLLVGPIRFVNSKSTWSQF